jgi:hypothetical protein
MPKKDGTISGKKYKKIINNSEIIANPECMIKFKKYSNKVKITILFKLIIKVLMIGLTFIMPVMKVTMT